jgi:hypothetical protein
MAAIDAAAAGPAVDATALRDAIGKLLPSKDLNATSIKALREELEEVLGLGPGGLDGQRALVRELLQEEIQLQLERATPSKRPVTELSLDTSLLELASVADLGDTSSDSESEGKEKKLRKAAKRARMARSAPTPLRRRDEREGGAPSKKRRGAAEGKADKGTAEGKAAKFRGKVEKAVRHYITENQDTWTASEMREDISVLHGWENDARFASVVKSVLFDLGYTNSGANVLKGNR